MCEMDLVLDIEYLRCRQQAMSSRLWAGSCPMFGALLRGISEFHRLHSPAKSQRQPLPSLVHVSGHIVRHFYHFRGCRQARVTTRLLLLLGPSVGGSWRMLPVIVKLPLDRRDLHRTTAADGRACRPNGRWALGTGLGCNGLADGRILSTGALRPLKPSQEPSSMHFGTAHSALDRLEGGN